MQIDVDRVPAKEDVLVQKDDGGEVITKKVLDWLTGVGAIATLLAAVFGLFLDNEKNAKLYAFGVATLLAIISSVVYFYQRRRAAKLSIAESLEPVSATASLRGLLPFEEGDELPGRARDVQELYTLLASSSFRFGVLWGESGCGKTSLLRAGLVPKLKNEKFLPIYINKPTNNPQEAIRSALLKEIGDLDKQTNKGLNQFIRSAAPKGKKIVILFDQFEEFFVTNRTQKSRSAFIKWLGEAIATDDLPIAILLSIRWDFFAQLQNFAPQIPEPTSIRTTYQLQNFDADQAKQIFSTAAKADGIPFEAELIQAVIRELETEEIVRPAELQVVGTRLKRKNITRLSQYEVLGGARGILSSYISDEIKQSLNDQTARLVLRLMCADAVETKSPTDLSLEDIVQGITGNATSSLSTPPTQIQMILNQFVAARVLIHTDEDKYNLAHDYLATYVRTATEGTETNTERANRLLKKYVAEYKEDPKMRIPFGKTHWIQRHASADVRSRDKAQELIAKSKRNHYGIIAASFMPAILLIGLYVFFLTQAYYFSTDKSFIVLRTGRPQYTFLPGFGRVVVQTDFRRDDIKDDATRDELEKGSISGFWFQADSATSSYPQWGEQLAQVLKADLYAKTLKWIGQTDLARKEMLAQMNDESVDLKSRVDAANGLAELAVAKPEIVTPEMLLWLVDVMRDQEPIFGPADWDTRSSAAQALGKLALANPKAITEETMRAIIDFTTSKDGGYVSDAYTLTNVLEILVESNPDVFTKDMFESLVIFVVNPGAGSYERSEVVDSLGAIIAAKPDVMEYQSLKNLIDFYTDPRSSPDVRSYMKYGDWSLEMVKPQEIRSDLLQTLIEFSINPEVDPEERSTAEQSFLIPLTAANPQAFSIEMTQLFVDVLTDPDAEPALRSSAASHLSSIASLKPELIPSELPRALIALLTEPQQDDDLRYYTTETLAQLAGAKPEVLTPSMIQTLRTIITDPRADPTIRSSAAYILESLFAERPQLATQDILQSLQSVLTNPGTDSDLRFSVLSALVSISKAQSDSVAPDTLQFMEDVITDTSQPFDRRVEMISHLADLAAQNPEIITAKLMQSMFDLGADSELKDYQYDQLSHTLRTLLRMHPPTITSEMLKQPMDMIINQQTDPKVRVSMARALAFVDPQIVTSEMISSLVTMLKSSSDSPGREAAADMLFVISLQDPENEEIILQELKEMQSAPQLHWRITSSRVLEMIAVGKLVAEARADPEKLEQVQARLRSMGANRYYFYNYSGSNQFFDSYIQYAVEFAFEEIDLIKLEDK